MLIVPLFSIPVYTLHSVLTQWTYACFTCALNTSLRFSSASCLQGLLLSYPPVFQVEAAKHITPSLWPQLLA